MSAAVLEKPQTTLSISLLAIAAVAVLVASLLPVGTASAHKVRKITAKSICRYEERYFVWTPGKSWWVKGRLKAPHRDKRVVLQRSKYGRNWRTWESTRTKAHGKYVFRGIAPNRGSRWWVNLRVVMPAQDGHKRAISLPLYVDMNPATRCR